MDKKSSKPWIREGLRFILVVLMISGPCVASEVRAADAVKIGYVDLRVVLNESESGKKAKAELESAIKMKQAAIDEKGKAGEKLKAELEKQSSVLSAEARKAKEEEVERAFRDYQRLVQDAQGEIKKQEEKYTGTIVKEIRTIIEKIGQEEGYSLILENFEGIILFSRKDLDITDRVIQRFNESKAKTEGTKEKQKE